MEFIVNNETIDNKFTKTFWGASGNYLGCLFEMVYGNRSLKGHELSTNSLVHDYVKSTTSTTASPGKVLF